MDVSWNWLRTYVDIGEPIETVTERLTMSGLNLESTTPVGQDFCIDLEVTSNRADCLGHLGVAREISVLFDCPLSVPDPTPASCSKSVTDICRVTIECPELCSRYTARIIRGVKIGPSPTWLVERLRTIGIESVNNVVDVSNFVMMECGQPLHTFDFERLSGGNIIVRRPKKDEAIETINHLEYKLPENACIIADSDRAVAIGGVMGGADTEITYQTKDVLIEAAWFLPGSVRATARQLNLHSDSSFRFERNVNVEGIDWASRRCAELILQVAGGELLNGVVDVDHTQIIHAPIVLRHQQIARVLGVEIPADFVETTLRGLGLELVSSSDGSKTWKPPSWRKDLSREIDLIEEIGRVYGYERVPDNVLVPMAASHRSPVTQALHCVRRVMVAAGFSEAMCPSLLPQVWSDAVSPWTSEPPLISQQAMLGVLEKGTQNVGAVNCLRRTLLSSLLEAKRINEYRSNTNIDLYETANVYLTNTNGLPTEPLMLGIVTGRSFFELKGLLESICREMNPAIELTFGECDLELFDISQNATLLAGKEKIGVLGSVSLGSRKHFGLRQPTAVGEINLTQLMKCMIDVRRHQAISEFPAVTRDFNLVVDENVPWQQIEAVVRLHANEWLENVDYREVFRNPQKDGTGKKRVLLSIQLRSRTATLSGPEVESVSEKVVAGCQAALGAVLAS